MGKYKPRGGGLEGLAGWREVGIPLPSKILNFNLIPYSRFSRSDQTDLEHFLARAIYIISDF